MVDAVAICDETIPDHLSWCARENIQNGGDRVENEVTPKQQVNANKHPYIALFHRYENPLVLKENRQFDNKECWSIQDLRYVEVLGIHRHSQRCIHSS